MLYGFFYFDIPENDRTGTDAMRAHLHVLGWDQVFEGKPGRSTAVWERNFDDNYTLAELRQFAQKMMVSYGLDTSHTILLTPIAPLLLGTATPYVP